MSKKEIYISVDIEADGRAPGLSSMLSFGAAAYRLDKTLVGTFSRNLELLPDARPEAKIMKEFWEGNPDAWQKARKDAEPPEKAIPEFVAWVRQISGDMRPIFVGYPASYDFKWIDYYCIRFADLNPFGFSGCIDLKTLA